MEKYRITIPAPTATLSAQDVNDIMATALEGGITHWCRSVDVILSPTEGWDGWASSVLTVGGILRFNLLEPSGIAGHETEDGEEYDFMNLEDFLRGFGEWAAWRIRAGHFWTTDPGNIDADMADEIVQFALLGEVVFS